MNYEEVVKFSQGHFMDGLVLVIGSGLASRGSMSGILPVAEPLNSRAGTLRGVDQALWSKIS